MDTNEGFLAVSSLHQIFWRATGNPNGIPVVILHGGPGAAINPAAEALFDLNRFRVVSFDQRGCGRSVPSGCLEENVTEELVEDIERLRQMLKIDRWMIFAGSWGTTLALLYSKRYPERCSGLLLRAVTEWSDEKYDWALFSRKEIEPLVFSDFHQISTARKSRDIVEDFVSALWCEDKDLQVFAAQTWKFAEKYFEIPQGRREIIGTNRDLGSPRNTTIVLTTRIQLHYWQNNAFIENSQMFEGRNDTFPIKLVHGQLDFVCPLAFARRANESLPNSSLRIVPLAGHAFDDKALLSALREEIDQMAIELEGSEVK